MLLNGTLDLKTADYPIMSAATHFTAPHQQLVIIPHGEHVLIEHSAVTPSTGGRPCGMKLMLDFLAAPTQPLDTGCINEIPPLDFHGAADVAQALFGTTDLYE